MVGPAWIVSSASSWQSIWTAQGEVNVRPCDVVVTSEGAVVVAGYDFVAGEDPDAYWLRAFTQ